MGKNFRKLYLLLWKNFLIQKRHPVRTTVEFVLPLLMSLTLVILRFQVDSTDVKDNTTFDEFTLEDCQEIFHYMAVRGEKWDLTYSPSDNTEVAAIMDRFFKMEISGQIVADHIRGVPFSNAKSMERYLMGKHITNTTIAGVSFDDSIVNGSLKKKFKVKLRFPGLSRVQGFISTTLDTQVPNWRTHLVFPLYQPFGPRDNFTITSGEPGYCEEGFLVLQDVLFRAIAMELTNKTSPEYTFQRFPYPPYTFDTFLPALISFISIFVIVSYVYSAVGTIKMVTIEKETQMKEAMKLMGLSNWMHWTAWYIKEFIQWVIPSVFITYLLTHEWSHGCVIRHSDPVILFAILSLYSLASIAFSFLVSVCFNRANSAATVGGALWFVLYSPYLIHQPKYSSMSAFEIMSWSLLSNTNLGYIFQTLVMYEGTGEGVQWNNIFTPVTPSDKVTLGGLLIMLLVDAVAYMCLALYIEAVSPGDYGMPLPWYYPFQATYWLGYRKDMYEAPPVRGIQIKNLTKVYPNKKIAVNRLTLDMYPNQITVLLGHNGAGKSSSMSMLTGLIKPTSGTAIIDGYDIWSEMSKIRDSLGLCPQYNLLFAELTIKEHLQFFGMLKGSYGDRLESDICKYVKRLGMESKLDSQAGKLSGGYKRKLSVAIALSGNSKVVLMDEPTSGMDPTARRCLWDLLQSERKGRTMVMTTHMMDEADLLGDRVAILNGGELMCVGTPFILKKKFGHGYTLSLVKKANTCVSNNEKITAFLRTFYPCISLTFASETELKYNVEESSNLSTLLEALANEQHALGIKEFGVSLTTLEDVYMKVAVEKNVEIPNNISFSTNISDSSIDLPPSMHPIQTTQAERNFKFWWRQFRAMLLKKMLISRRSLFLHSMQLLTTFVFIIIAIIVSDAWRGSTNLIPLDLTLNQYREPVTIVVNATGNTTWANGVPGANGIDFGEVLTAFKSSIGQKTKVEFVDANTDVDEYVLKLYHGRVHHVNERYIMVANFANDSNYVKIHFNNQPYHSLPTALNTMQNTILHALSSGERGVTFVNFPLPFIPSEMIAKLEGGSNLGFQVAFNVGFAQAFVCAIFLVMIIKEQESGAKHLQFISGVHPMAYWMASVLWDYVVYLGPIFVVAATLYSYQDAAFSDLEQLAQVISLMLAFNWAFVPIMNLMSYFFDVPSMGFMKTSLLNVLTGCTMFLIVLILEIRPLKLTEEAEFLDYFMIIFPHYALSNGLRNIYINHGQKNHCNMGYCDWEGNYQWSKPGIGRNLFVLGILGLIFNAVLLSLEHVNYKLKKINSTVKKYWHHLRVKPGVESDLKPVAISLDEIDVMSEKHTAEISSTSEYCVLIKDVYKKYGNFYAVKSLNLALKMNECFALLGSNGAGKTSTFKMLTSKVNVSSGSIYIRAMDIIREKDKVSQLIGYCPQSDALLNKLTGRETLTMFCTLRGVSECEQPFVIKQLSKRLTLQKFLDIPAGKYSGGNKRKLSTAVAMIGDPPVLLLDEPTSGMDPEARRHLWNTINEERERGKCIIITTHSLEECEALCTRLAIMVEGEIKCIGSVQHLKNKYAAGYKLHVKFPPNVQENVKWYICATLTGSRVHEEFEGMILFHIPSNVPCSKVFSTMEKAKEEGLIEDYSIQQTSLEQVFTQLTRRQ